MLQFCGQDKVKIDANGRFKLAQHFIDDFISRCGGRVVMHCLPEGAVAVYPEEVFAELRRNELAGIERAGASLVARRSLRRFGALSAPGEITRQGRISLPAAFRSHSGIAVGGDACVIGVEIGVEVWSQEKWQKELESINADALTKGEREVAADLLSTDIGELGS